MRMSTEFNNPHTAEVAHDTRLLELLADRHRAAARVAYTVDRMVQLAAANMADRIAYRYEGRHRVPVVKATDRRLTYTTAVELLNEFLAADSGASKPNPRRDRALAAVVDTIAVNRTAIADRDEATDAIDEHESRYTGWSRFFLVVSSAGHVHRDMGCSTCYPTTGYAPLPSLSGTSEAEAVALVGPALCSVCFPLAPADTTGAKLTMAIVETLITEGEDAFRAKLAEAVAKRATKCDSGWDDIVEGSYRRHGMSSYAVCAKCGAHVTLTSTGKMRAHKPKAES